MADSGSAPLTHQLLNLLEVPSGSVEATEREMQATHWGHRIAHGEAGDPDDWTRRLISPGRSGPVSSANTAPQAWLPATPQATLPVACPGWYSTASFR